MKLKRAKRREAIVEAEEISIFCPNCCSCDAIPDEDGNATWKEFVPETVACPDCGLVFAVPGVAVIPVAMREAVGGA